MSVRPELIIFLDVTTRQAAVEQKIKAFLTKWPEYRQKMPLVKMTEMRIKPDLPVYQHLLDEMFLMMLDGKLKTEAEIVKYLEPHQPPLPVAPPTPARRGRAKKKAVVAAAAPTIAAVPAPAEPTKKAIANASAHAEKGSGKTAAISAKKNEVPPKPVLTPAAKKASDSKPAQQKKAAKRAPKPKQKAKKPSKPQKKASPKKKK
jgi:hypothetical protein